MSSDTLPALLGPQEMATIFRITVSQFHRCARRGSFDLFKVTPKLGPKCYSSVLVQRYLEGQSAFVPSFGRRRA